MIRGKSHSGSIYLFLFSFIELLVSMVLSNKSFSFSEVRSFQEIKASSCKLKDASDKQVKAQGSSLKSRFKFQVLPFEKLLLVLFDCLALEANR